MTAAGHPPRRGRFSGVLALLLVVVGTAALTWSAAYYHFSGTPAPLPTSTFGDDPTSRPAGSTSNPAASGTDSGNPGPAATAPKLTKNVLDIPSLHVNAPVDYFGIDDTNALTLPEPDRVALYTYGSYPGDPHGTVLVAGHVNSRTLGQGALYRLAEIKQGAVIWVSDQAGQTHGYRAVQLKVLRKEALPQDLFGRMGDPRLVIVTCGGNIVTTPTGRHYESNVIVVALPLGTAS